MRASGGVTVTGARTTTSLATGASVMTMCIGGAGGVTAAVRVENPESAKMTCVSPEPTSIVNRPRSSVTATAVVPRTVTTTPGRGRPAGSTTSPAIELDWGASTAAAINDEKSHSSSHC